MKELTRIRILILLLLLAPGLALSVPPDDQQGPLEQGLAAYKAGRYQDALKL